MCCSGLPIFCFIRASSAPSREAQSPLPVLPSLPLSSRMSRRSALSNPLLCLRLLPRRRAGLFWIDPLHPAHRNVLGRYQRDCPPACVMTSSALRAGPQRRMPRTTSCSTLAAIHCRGPHDGQNQTHASQALLETRGRAHVGGHEIDRPGLHLPAPRASGRTGACRRFQAASVSYPFREGGLGIKGRFYNLLRPRSEIGT
jgi:hypothetical protein